jgi:hypothetical protein
VRVMRGSFIFKDSSVMSVLICWTIGFFQLLKSLIVCKVVKAECRGYRRVGVGEEREWRIA